MSVSVGQFSSPGKSDSHVQISTEEIVSRLVTILRRDLKLGPDALIQPSTPLLKGDYDLDSLDILMLLTSVEREFNIKIPNDAVRREAFTNVGTLARYIDERRR